MKARLMIIAGHKGQIWLPVVGCGWGLGAMLFSVDCFFFMCLDEKREVVPLTHSVLGQFFFFHH